MNVGPTDDNKACGKVACRRSRLGGLLNLYDREAACGTATNLRTGRTPKRGRRMSWATFIKAHLGAIVGMGFFRVEAMTWLGLGCHR